MCFKKCLKIAIKSKHEESTFRSAVVARMQVDFTVSVQPCCMVVPLFFQKDGSMCSLRQKIDELDLEPIALKIQRKLRWSDERMEQAVQGYRNYLFECGVGGDAKLLLTQDVDEIWHGHILDTQRYSQDCDNLFGYFLHHVPSYTGQTCDRARQVTCDRMPATCDRRPAVCESTRTAVSQDVPAGTVGDVADLLSCN